MFFPLQVETRKWNVHLLNMFNWDQLSTCGKGICGWSMDDNFQFIAHGWRQFLGQRSVSFVLKFAFSPPLPSGVQISKQNTHRKFNVRRSRQLFFPESLRWGRRLTDLTGIHFWVTSLTSLSRVASSSFAPHPWIYCGRKEKFSSGLRYLIFRD